jgi:hypothetical protein
MLSACDLVSEENAARASELEAALESRDSVRPSDVFAVLEAQMRRLPPTDRDYALTMRCEALRVEIYPSGVAGERGDLFDLETTTSGGGAHGVQTSRRVVDVGELRAYLTQVERGCASVSVWLGMAPALDLAFGVEGTLTSIRR